jgi:hypothetical protein
MALSYKEMQHTLMEELGSSAITRPGDGFPGADICKNCPLILFRKAKKSAE